MNGRQFVLLIILTSILSMSLTLNVVMLSSFEGYMNIRSNLISLGLGLVSQEFPSPSRPSYREFLDYITSDRKYNVYPVCEYNSSYRQDKVNIILRHDLDFDNGCRMAELEVEYGIRSTYYLRLHSNEYDIRDLIPFYQRLEREGYEIGYRYEVVDLFLFSNETAGKVFEMELGYLRSYFNVRSVASHGGRYNYQFRSWTNLDRYDVISAYEIPLTIHLADCSRQFAEKKLEYLVEELENLQPGDVAEVLIHPCHWSCP